MISLFGLFADTRLVPACEHIENHSAGTSPSSLPVIPLMFETTGQKA